MEKIKKILVLSPHTDDAEFSCGASIDRFIKEGKQVHYANFSPCYKSIPKGFEKDTLKKEMRKAALTLGVSSQHLTEFEYPVRHFPKYRQEILEDMILLKKKINPDLVLLPNSFDFHQDHETIRKEGLRAFKNTCVLGYEFPWNNIETKINFIISISQENFNVKMEAIACYNSQSFRKYKDIELFKGLAKVRGIQSNTQLAEGFELIKWID